MNVLILTTGSVSAKLSHKLAVRLEADGHSVRHYATRNALEMMKADGPSGDSDASVTFYTGHWSPYIGVTREILDWRDKPAKPILHIDLVRWADVCAVCPADFNVVGKMANGIADDVVSSVLAAWLGTDKKIYICEAMNSWMYQNPIHQENAAKLDRLGNVRFIEPTVKKLACGDVGIGALADIDTIANIIEGHTWTQPIANGYLLGEPAYSGRSDMPHGMFGQMVYDADSNGFKRGRYRGTFREYLPKFYEPGAFGAIRKFDIHEGVDVYTYDGAEVRAVEDGVVTAIYEFTGKKVDCPWWNPTWCIKVKGKSGVVTYGELAEPYGRIYVGKKVHAGDFIGFVTPVLKPEKYRPDIRNHSVAMLHIELRTETCRLDGWKHGEQRDRKLLDPTPYLKSKDIVAA